MSIHFMWRRGMDVCASFNVVVWFDEVVFVQTRCTRLLSRFGIYSMCILPSILSCAEWMYAQGVFISYFNVSLNSCIHALHPPLFTSNTVQGCWSSLLFRSWSIQNTRIYFQLVFSECQSLFIQMPSPLLY